MVGVWIVLLLVIAATSVWVFIDAENLDIRKGQVKPRWFEIDLGPGGWLIFCLLFWILALPLYLHMRPMYAKVAPAKRESSRPARSMMTRAERDAGLSAEIERLADLKQRGLLTAKEFAAAKAQVIGTTG